MKMLKILIPVGVVIVILAIVVPIAVVFTRSEETDDALLVNTTVGVIRGLRADDGSAMFLGVPYAFVNESNSFGPAIPNPTFEDVFNANDDSARCPQTMNVQETTLDCLRLNIHVPKTDDNGLLPVLVYIHGGAFNIGTSGRTSAGPKFLIRHNVIFVSFNYRLGPYGFMCMDRPEVPGNQGLKDQLIALRWIKRNIRYFGGDDETITIFGGSAGGMSVDTHILFAEEGLFHKAICLSGTSLGLTSYLPPDLEAAFKIASRLGFETNDTSEALAFLTSQTPTQIITTAQALQIVFRPCAEKEFPNVERYVHTHPVNAPVPRARDIPLLAGYSSEERLTTFANRPAAQFETLDTFNENINLGFDFGEKHDAMKLFVRRFYAGDEPMSANLRQALIELESDMRFAHPTQRTLKKYLDYGGVAYHYVFTYVGGRNLQRIRSNTTTGGAAHTDDLGYLFDLPELADTPTPDDQLMIDRLTTIYTNFVKYGNPTPSTTTLLPIQWLPITRDRLSYMNLTLDLDFNARPFHKRLSFWDFFYHTNRQYIIGYSNETYAMK